LKSLLAVHEQSGGEVLTQAFLAAFVAVQSERAEQMAGRKVGARGALVRYFDKVLASKVIEAAKRQQQLEGEADLREIKRIGETKVQAARVATQVEFGKRQLETQARNSPTRPNGDGRPHGGRSRPSFDDLADAAVKTSEDSSHE
jgi:hypothetical protein